MSVLDWSVLVLRGFGVLYVVGGAWGAKQALFLLRAESSMDTILDALDSLKGAAAPPRVTDNGRNVWLLTGALLLAACGVAMVLARALAVPLLAALVVHQLFYFIRQRRRELAAPNAEQAEEARPARATINGFFSGLIITVMAAWLYAEGMLDGRLW